MRERLRIVVAGMAGYFPLGGVAWDYFQYVTGFAGLGHDVYYYEDIGAAPYDPTVDDFPGTPDYTVRYFKDFFGRYAPELAERWHYRHLSDETFGVAEQTMDEVLRSADLFINVSGSTRLPDCLPADCVTVFLDTDPGYNQLVLEHRYPWHAHVDAWASSVAQHDVHATYAENINAPDCLIPHVGLKWIPSRIPIHSPSWTVAPEPPAGAPWSTVMTWNGFKGPLEHDGRIYGSKDLEFPRLEQLPSRVPRRFTIAFGGANAPVERVRAAGWDPLDDPSATVFPDRYQAMIQASRGEISVAKNVYAAPKTGWFSGRSTCYLASGRPVVAQDTGYSHYLPTGEGLFAWTTLDEAVGGLETVEASYERHARAAREIAIEYFDSRRVLRKLIDDAFATAPAVQVAGVTHG